MKKQKNFTFNEYDITQTKKEKLIQTEYKKKAVKYINSCDRDTKRRIKDAIEKIPCGDIKKLTGYENEYRLRIGDLRVLFTKENDKIIINAVLPRGQAYNNL